MAAPLLKFVRIPGELLQLDIASKTELLILALVVAFENNGLTMSNASLAKFLNVKRNAIIKAIQRLKYKGYIVNAGKDDFHRKLIANSICGATTAVSQIVSAEHPNSIPAAPQMVSAGHQNSIPDATHNRIIEIKKKEEKAHPSSSKIDWDKIDRYNQAYKEGRYEPM